MPCTPLGCVILAKTVLPSLAGVPAVVVGRSNIVGRPLFIYWSFQTPGDQWEKTSVGDRVAFYGHVALHFVDETRWSRMFRRVR